MVIARVSDQVHTLGRGSGERGRSSQSHLLHTRASSTLPHLSLLLRCFALPSQTVNAPVNSCPKSHTTLRSQGHFHPCIFDSSTLHSLVVAVLVVLEVHYHQFSLRKASKGETHCCSRWCNQYRKGREW